MIKDCIKSYSKEGVFRIKNPIETVLMACDKLTENNILKDTLFVHEFKHPNISFPRTMVYGTKKFTDITTLHRVSGKGYTTEQAYASGLMEMAERYSCMDYVIKGVKDINVLNNVSNPLPMMNYFNRFCGQSRLFYKQITEQEAINTEMRLYEFQTMNGETFLAPMGLMTYISANGMASGNTFEEAFSHALCEIIERHCHTIIDVYKIQAPTINMETCDSPVIQDILAKLKLYNYKVLIKDCSLDSGIPVAAAIFKTPGDKYLIKYACATSFEEAVIRALTETIQADNPLHHCDYKTIKHHFLPKTERDFSDTPNILNENIKLEIMTILSKLKSNQMETYYVDCTSDELEIPTVYVYIEGAKFDPYTIMTGVYSNYIDERIVNIFKKKNVFYF